MAEPTLAEVFGASASQDATTLTITKASLPGLTPATNNTAESLLAAIVLQCFGTLTDQARQADVTGDRQVTTIDLGEQIFNDGTQDFLLKGFAIQFYSPYTASGFDPDDY